jgi:hypothetical protein
MDDRDDLVRDAQVKAEFSISAMTLYRWDKQTSCLHTRT